MAQIALHRLPSRHRPKLMRASGWNIEAVRTGQYDIEVTHEPRQSTFVEESKSVCAVIRLPAPKIDVMNSTGIGSDPHGATSRWTNSLDGMTGDVRRMRV